MKKALISPEEVIYHISEGTPLGVRIAQVENESFDIAEPLFWIECHDQVNANDWYYDVDKQDFKLKPVPELRLE